MGGGRLPWCSEGDGLGALEAWGMWEGGNGLSGIGIGCCGLEV